jgi:hypothetical protein
MKFPTLSRSVWVLLLVSLGVLWLKHAPCPLEVVTAWAYDLGSLSAILFAGLFGLAPTLALRNAMPSLTGTALCAAILGRIELLMGTTLGVMMVCRGAHPLVGVLSSVGRRLARVVLLPWQQGRGVSTSLFPTRPQRLD